MCEALLKIYNDYRSNILLLLIMKSESASDSLD
nr:MAG TPA: hypothetical protein [Caudoviricetes sp.]